MSKRSAMIIVAMLAVFILKPAMAVEPGQIAPEITLPGESGQTIRLSDYQDKVVYLYFWASWCGSCKQSFPWLNAMQSKYGVKGLQVIAVNLDAKTEDARHFLVENPVNFLIAMDTKASTPAVFNIKGMHTSLLVALGGKVVARQVMIKDADKDMIESSIKQLLASREPINGRAL